MRVYLCGPIHGCTDGECTNWRAEAAAALPDTVDPLANHRDFRGREHEHMAEIVEDDKLAIMGCDALLVNFTQDKQAIGTCMEILFAWEQHKIIIVVAPRWANLSPWLHYHASAVVHRFEDAYAWLNYPVL